MDHLTKFGSVRTEDQTEDTAGTKALFYGESGRGEIYAHQSPVRDAVDAKPSMKVMIGNDSTGRRFPDFLSQLSSYDSRPYCSILSSAVMEWVWHIGSMPFWGSSVQTRRTKYQMVSGVDGTNLACMYLEKLLGWPFFWGATKSFPDLQGELGRTMCSKISGGGAYATVLANTIDAPDVQMLGVRAVVADVMTEATALHAAIEDEIAREDSHLWLMVEEEVGADTTGCAY